MVLHRIEEIPAFATHAALISGGRIRLTGPLEDVIRSEPLSRLYGVELDVGKKAGHYYCTPASAE